MVVDVRRNPISRKKGFSRSRLSEFLLDNDVEYQHVRELGVPNDLRAQLRDEACTLDEYFVGFRAYLTSQDQALDDLYSLATRRRCCLVCVEHESHECHRSVVAEEVVSRNGHRVEIVHV